MKNITDLKFEDGIQTNQENLNQVEPNIFSDYSNPILSHVAIFKAMLDEVKLQKESSEQKEKLE